MEYLTVSVKCADVLTPRRIIVGLSTVAIITTVAIFSHSPSYPVENPSELRNWSMSSLKSLYGRLGCTSLIRIGRAQQRSDAYKELTVRCEKVNENYSIRFIRHALTQ